MQPKRKCELKFVHPQLLQKLWNGGIKVRGKKFYINHLSNKPNSDGGLVNGKLSLLKDQVFDCPPNSNDLFNHSPTWVNKQNDHALDKLISSIKSYLN